jgi:hypothetical protein
MILTAKLFKDKTDTEPSQVYPVGNYDDYERFVQLWLTDHPNGKVEFIVRQKD